MELQLLLFPSECWLSKGCFWTSFSSLPQSLSHSGTETCQCVGTHAHLMFFFFSFYFSSKSYWVLPFLSADSSACHSYLQLRKQRLCALHFHSHNWLCDKSEWVTISHIHTVKLLMEPWRCSQQCLQSHFPNLSPTSAFKSEWQPQTKALKILLQIIDIRQFYFHCLWGCWL